ncbi:MAG: sulfate adenylyltransferase subunit 2 [Halanaerobium sp.]|nr:MAG: sulfate adenylyltransferase subunit 2 [Halanaerobium sp.]
MDHLDKLESRSIHILREAYSEFNNICMLWSVGKDSTAMLWLARKAFFGHVPIPLVHIDTSYMIPEMIEHRDKLAKKWNLDMIYGQDEETLAAGDTFPNGGATHLECCGRLKTAALKNTLNGNWRRYYRSLGCAPCTEPVESTASTVDEVVEELKTGKFANIAEREGRAQDKEDGGGLEELRKDGYM